MAKKIALVTGASGGIGASCARELARRGYTVLLHAHRGMQSAQALEAEYQIAQLVTTEPFRLEFQVDTSAALTIPLEPIQAEGKTLLLRELRLSAREIALELERDEAYDASLRAPLTITLTDGTVLEPWNYGGHQSEAACTLEYTLLTEDGVPCLLDTSQVASVTIGDVTFDLA